MWYRREKITWVNYVSRYAATTAFHPLEYSKVLIQLGHKPIAPWPTKTLFGFRALALPSVLQNVSYIKGVDGFYGCYRGLAPKLCARLANSLTYQSVQEGWQFSWERRRSHEDRIYGDASSGDDEGVGDEDEVSEEEESLTEHEERQRFVVCLSRDVVGRTVAVVVSHPFQVMTIRTMAQFVGGETLYSGVFASIREVYKEGGILSFFSGVVPRIIGELLTLVIARTAAFTINTYLLEGPVMKTYTSITIEFLAGMMTYPFHVVSNCMAVTNCGLAAGSPPSMLHYTSWTDCWSHLSQSGELRRG